MNIPYPPHPDGWLRVRGEWPGRRAAEKRDELASSHHSITSTARASKAGRYVEAEGLSCLEVDNQFELGRLQHRKLRRFGALEYPPGIDAGLAIGVGETCPVADQAASEPEPAVEVDCRYAIPGRELDELILPTIEKRIRTNHQSHAR